MMAWFTTDLNVGSNLLKVQKRLSNSRLCLANAQNLSTRVLLSAKMETSSLLARAIQRNDEQKVLYDTIIDKYDIQITEK